MEREHHWRELATAHLSCAWQDRCSSRNNQTTSLTLAQAAFEANGLGHLTNDMESEQVYSRVLPQANMNDCPPAPLFRHDDHELYREPTLQRKANEGSSCDSLYKQIMRFIGAVDVLTVSRFGVKYSELIDIVKDEMDEVERELETMVAERHALRTVDRELEALEAERDAISARLLSRLRVPRGVGAAKSNISFPTEASLCDLKPAALVLHDSPPHLLRNESRGESKAEDENKGSNSKSYSSPFEDCNEDDTQSDPSPLKSVRESREDDNRMCLPIGTDVEVKKTHRRRCKVNECTNRVVQGGLCMKHGAKRKLCNVTGCTKNVKSKGKCSTHGPERKKCEVEGCAKVAVQGGKCRNHGAKLRHCSVEGCIKQAQSRLNGVCKMHYNEHNGIEPARRGRKRKYAKND